MKSACSGKLRASGPKVEIASGGESVAGLDVGQGMRLPGGANLTVENVAGKGLSATASVSSSGRSIPSEEGERRSPRNGLRSRN